MVSLLHRATIMKLDIAAATAAAATTTTNIANTSSFNWHSFPTLLEAGPDATQENLLGAF